ncbi:MAG: tail fiber protein [archaeon]
MAELSLWWLNQNKLGKDDDDDFTADYAVAIKNDNGTFTVNKSVPSNAVFTDTTYNNATTNSSGLMSSKDKTKLNSIESGAEVNQNAFGKIKVNTTYIDADSEVDTLEIKSGAHITLSPESSSDAVTISSDGEPNQNAFSYVDFLNDSDSSKGKLSADRETDTISFKEGEHITLSPNTDNDLITISSDGEPNQNAFSIVKVGSTNIQADTEVDTLELIAGRNVTLTPSTSGDSVKIDTESDPNVNTFGKVTIKNNSGTTLGTLESDKWSDVLIMQEGNNVNITYNEADDSLVISSENTWRDIDDTPSNGSTSTSISSNWAYEHNGNRASTSSYGHTKLNDGITSTSTTEAATANAVRKAYVKGNHGHPYLKLSGGTVNGLLTLTGRESPSIGNKGDYFAAVIDARGNDDGGLLIRADDNNGDENSLEIVNDGDSLLTIKATSGNLNTSGTITGSKVYNAVYNDVAELFKCQNKNNFHPGDVLIWTKNGIEKSNSNQTNLVIGVYSDTYGYLLGGEEREEIEKFGNYVPVGISGRVEVKVKGNIKIGDLLISSDIPGVATKMEKYIPGTVIGKALENYSSDSIKRIKMLIMNV